MESVVAYQHVRCSKLRVFAFVYEARALIMHRTRISVFSRGAIKKKIKRNVEITHSV